MRPRPCPPDLEVVVKEPFLKRVSNYDDLWSQIDYRKMAIPEKFNLGVACVDDHDPAARALTIVDKDRTSRDYTFGDVRDDYDDDAR